MDWFLLTSSISQLLHGLLITLELVAGGLFFGFLLAGIMSLCCISGKIWLSVPVKIWVFIIRGTPLLVQIFLIYYGCAQFDWLRQSDLWIAFKQPLFCAILAFSINSSAYTTEIFLGAIKAIPYGEIEAALSFGMPWLTLFRRIIAPRAMRIVLPAYTNEVIMLIKGSSLASTITLMDIMGATQLLIDQTYIVIEFYFMAGMIYLMLNAIMVWLFTRLERHWNVYLAE